MLYQFLFIRHALKFLKEYDKIILLTSSKNFSFITASLTFIYSIVYGFNVTLGSNPIRS